MLKNEMVAYLLQYLIKENKQFKIAKIPKHLDGQENLLRILFNVRPPMPVSSYFLRIQNQYLQLKAAERTVVFLNQLQPLLRNNRLYIWQGDMTRLKVDAIVNDASQDLLGCFHPLHNCTDNSIHTYSGVQLRLDCHHLMQEQGEAEPIASAKITSAYNLPAKCVIHTISPKITSASDLQHLSLLRQAYWACLTIAEKNQLQSLALPILGKTEQAKQALNLQLVQVAVATACAFLEQSHSIKHLVFSASNQDEYQLFQRLLNQSKPIT